MGEKSEVLFKVFGLGVTAEVTTMWAIVAVLIVLAFIISRHIKEKPGKLQNAVEVGVGALENFIKGVLGEEKTKRYFGFFATLFIFIAFCNYSGLLPGAGIIKGFKAPTSSLSVTAGLGIVVFCAIHYLGVRSNGVHYFKHFIKPVVIMLPFMIIDEIVRPVSLALRLFGNIFGEETVMEQLYEILPIGAPLLMMVLSLLFCGIQAVVFTMLAGIYIDDATTLE